MDEVQIHRSNGPPAPRGNGGRKRGYWAELLTPCMDGDWYEVAGTYGSLNNLGGQMRTGKGRMVIPGEGQWDARVRRDPKNPKEAMLYFRFMGGDG
jgi:hypothetical protein